MVQEFNNSCQSQELFLVKKFPTLQARAGKDHLLEYMICPAPKVAPEEPSPTS